MHCLFKSRLLDFVSCQTIRVSLQPSQSHAHLNIATNTSNTALSCSFMHSCMRAPMQALIFPCINARAPCFGGAPTAVSTTSRGVLCCRAVLPCGPFGPFLGGPGKRARNNVGRAPRPHPQRCKGSSSHATLVQRAELRYSKRRRSGERRRPRERCITAPRTESPPTRSRTPL